MISVSSGEIVAKSIKRMSVKLLMAISFSLFSFVPTASALPKSKIYNLLDSVVVYVFVDQNNQTIAISENESPVMIIFFDLNEALASLNSVRSKSSKPKESIKLSAFNLGKFLQIHEKIKAIPGSKKPALITVARQSEISYAKEISATNDNPDVNFVLPVFFTDPIMTSNFGAEGVKQTFFLNHQQLKEAVSNLPAEKKETVKIKALDISKILKILEDSTKDEYAFYPNLNYFTMKEVIENN